MDFFGFHPLYIVILLALALIIFGPSRLPKMGAQVGRMLREFQIAREGLTQQMRDAFEESAPDFGPSSGPDVDSSSTYADDDTAKEAEPSSDGSVAVLDPPEPADESEHYERSAALDPPTEPEAADPEAGDPPATGLEAAAPEADAGVADPPAAEVDEPAPVTLDPPGTVVTPLYSPDKGTESR